MRKILFRAKSIEKSNKGKWVQGFYFIKQNTNTIDGFPVTHHISDFPPFGFRIDPETLGQYTGINDKNGTKIFEGDKVIYDMDEFGHIDFCAGQFCFVSENDGLQSGLLWEDCSDEFEVIGNIHDKDCEEV